MVIIAKKKKSKFEVGKHVLVPKHTKLSDKELEKLLEQYKITVEELPMIKLKDAALSSLDVEIGDVVSIERKSPTAKNTVFYRRVVK